MQGLVENTSRILKSLFPDGASLHEPCFGGNEWKYVKECIDTVWVSSVGRYVDRFEADLASFTGTKRAVVTVNGTAALFMCLKQAGAHPHFVDCDERSLGVDPQKLEKYLEEITQKRNGACVNKNSGRRIAALIVMHAFGHPSDMDALAEVSKKYGLVLIEDAAESLGSYLNGRHTGQWGSFAALSFNGNKTVTTGGGGAILTNDEAAARLAKHLTTTAKEPHPWRYFHDQVGYNHRMPNINAALGCAQLEQLPSFLEKKRKLAHSYMEAFSGVSGLKVFSEPENARSNYWLNLLMLGKADPALRDEILDSAHKHCILCRPAWVLMNKLPMFKDCQKMDLSCSENLEGRLVCLPSSAFLSK